MTTSYIDEYRAFFYVLGGTVHPKEITAQLQIEPDLTHEKGGIRAGQPGHPMKTYPENLWRFSSPAMADDENKAESHIEFILKAIEPHSDFLALLAKDAELFLEVDCKLDERFKSTSYKIDRSLLARLVRLQVTIGHSFRLAANEHP